ncbi:hypothetical protein M426DRAFT_268655 [Hypoxylon sp. CI-4A]|nr:hypothetical protein M426DRAFT_268655 [Hypoxylon sp. CI-4A]
MAVEESPRFLLGEITMVVVVAAVLRFMRDLSLLEMDEDLKTIALFLLYIGSLSTTLCFWFSDSHPDGVAEANLSGLLTVCACVLCNPIDGRFIWFVDLLWWFWAGFFVQIFTHAFTTLASVLELMQKEKPKHFSANMSTALGGCRVFLDIPT